MEYTTRLTHKYADAYMVGSSVAIHKRTNAKSLNVANETEKSRIQIYHYYYRNRAITQRYYKTGSFVILKTLVKNAGAALRVLRQKNGRLKAAAVIRGTAESFTQYKKFRTYIDGELIVKAKKLLFEGNEKA